MSVSVRLHPYLRKFADGQKVVETAGQTVGECIDDLEVKFPGMQQRLLDKQGKLRSSWDIYVNWSSSDLDELAIPVKNGDEIIIVAVIAGG